MVELNKKQEEQTAVAKIQPFDFYDRVMGCRVGLRIGEYFSIFYIGERCYYFIKETGEFDETSMPMKGD